MAKNNSSKKINDQEQEVILKAKRKRGLIGLSIFAVILVGWLGFAIWDDSTGGFGDPSKTEVNFDSIHEYMSELSEN